jgi:hypothetical protein
VNLKIAVQRVGLNLHKSGLGAAYWARVCWLEHEQLILKTHVLSLRPTMVRCGLRTLKKVSFDRLSNAVKTARPWSVNPDSPAAERAPVVTSNECAVRVPARYEMLSCKEAAELLDTIERGG